MSYPYIQVGVEFFPKIVFLFLAHRCDVARKVRGVRFAVLGLVDALAMNSPVQTIERYTELEEKHGLHLRHYEMRDLHIHDLRRTLGS